VIWVKVSVLPSLNSTGGTRRVCLSTVEAPKNAGHEVILDAVEPTNWHSVRRRSGQTTRPDGEVPLLPFRLDRLGIYLGLLTAFLAMRLRRRSDLLIVARPNSDVAPHHVLL
jgi:hypothetical protein